MTRHRKPQEWIDEILKAASTEIEENGYASLTMEAVARRVELSKGGVYRFFSNKQDLSLALFTSCYAESLEIDVDNAVSWDLSIVDTFNRVLLQFHDLDEDKLTSRRVWLHIMPEVLRDERFRAERERLLIEIEARFADLARRLLEREGFPVTPEMEERISAAIKLGVALFEGFTIQRSLGSKIEQEALTRMFVESLVDSSLLRAEEGPGDREPARIAATEVPR